MPWFPGGQRLESKPPRLSLHSDILGLRAWMKAGFQAESEKKIKSMGNDLGKSVRELATAAKGMWLPRRPVDQGHAKDWGVRTPVCSGDIKNRGFLQTESEEGAFMLVRANVVLLMPVCAWFILIPKTSSIFRMCLAPKTLHTTLEGWLLLCCIESRPKLVNSGWLVS